MLERSEERPIPSRYCRFAPHPLLASLHASTLTNILSQDEHDVAAQVNEALTRGISWGTLEEDELQDDLDKLKDEVLGVEEVAKEKDVELNLLEVPTVKPVEMPDVPTEAPVEREAVKEKEKEKEERVAVAS